MLGTEMHTALGPVRWADSRDNRHVVVKLAQELWQRQGLVHANDVLQLLCRVSWEGDPSLPEKKTVRVEDPARPDGVGWKTPLGA